MANQARTTAFIFKVQVVDVDDPLKSHAQGIGLAASELSGLSGLKVQLDLSDALRSLKLL